MPSSIPNRPPTNTCRANGRKGPDHDCSHRSDETHQGIEGNARPAVYIEHSTLDHELYELISFRASQMNGCAWCLDMHSKELRARGVSEQKIYLLSAWREVPLYTDRERAALAWTEAVTRLENQEVPDDVFEEAKRHFSEAELVDLTLAIISINGFNRLNVAFRTVPGSYKPRSPAPEGQTTA